MENLPVQTAGFAAWTEQIVASLHAETQRHAQFLTAQQTRLERAEATLEEAIAQLEAAVSNEPRRRRPTRLMTAARRSIGGGMRWPSMICAKLKASNSSLQEQLSKARVAASTFAKEDRAHQPSLNWETEKLRILAALESELDENNSEQRAERLKIEEVLQSTKRAIAEKDKEIQELKQRLEKSASAEPLDQMAAAIEQTLQNDIVIQQERERLRQLDEQLQSRLCRAEIEISLERAKLARDRAEIEERLRAAGLDAAKTPADSKGATAEPPPRGRWLSRLGLTEADRERGKRR